MPDNESRSRERGTAKGYKMIKSGRELAWALDGGKSVDESMVSKRLARIVALWASRKEIIIENGKITGRF